jgi:hypothetical protein
MKTKKISVIVPEKSDLPPNTTHLRFFQTDVNMYCGYFDPDDLEFINPKKFVTASKFILHVYDSNKEEYYWNTYEHQFYRV